MIVCGDFQAVRNVNDLKCMAVPDKYKEIGDFHKFYSGQIEASHLTLGRISFFFCSLFFAKLNF